jgi:arsenate reductase (glutaredoxin)
MTLQVYGIPSCSTCKKAIAWLQAEGIAHEFINTKDHPPDHPTIAQWVAHLGNKPLRNTSGQSYRALGETKDSWGDPEWVDAFTADAMLLKRPLFVQNQQAVYVGFRDTTALQQALGLD